MKGIDYGAIHIEAWKNKGVNEGSFPYVKAVIDAYEAQKTQPEWVPLDLATVKQGQEVRHPSWVADCWRSFVAVYRDLIVLERFDGSMTPYAITSNWLMRAPKPKTVKVKMWKRPDGKAFPFLDGNDPTADGWSIVGEGEIEVQE